MKVIKRNGTIVDFNINKIETAITNAFKEIKINSPHIEMDPVIIAELAEEVRNSLKCFQDAVSVEDIQDMVEETLMKNDFYEVSRAYIRYRYKKELLRNNRQNVYESVLQLVDLKNEELKDENSNKNAIIASTQRDYMAGEVSKELSKQFLLPFDVLDAHEKGIIHFHDMDYYAQHISNCCLVNLDDMLQNGTVINGTLIQKPHSFLTACNIATQIMAVVASGQYGGQSITLSHLAPFVDISRQKIKNEIIQEFYSSRGLEDHMDEKINELTNKRLKKEIKAGVQTIQYQINTLNTSNG